MSRPLRIQYPDAWYHVMNRGRRGEKIFTKKEDYWSFVDLLGELDEVFNVKIAAYCLMSSHYHLLVQTPDANLSRSMRHLRNDTLKQVGEQFGIEKYSTVSSIVERVKYEMKVDKSLKHRIQDLADKITKSQRQTHLPG